MTEDIRKELPLEDVEYKDGQATLTFIDFDSGEVVPVRLSLNKFNPDTKQREPDEEQAEKTENTCQEYFGVSFDELTKAIGQKHDIYVYDRFASLYYVELVEKFDKSREGEIITTSIKDIQDNGNMIKIRFEEDGKTYESKMNYSNYHETYKKYFVDPMKKNKQYEKFQEKFGVPVEESDSIIGNDITVEIKVAFGKFPYAEIKNPKWAK